jgi:MFS family permease
VGLSAEFAGTSSSRSRIAARIRSWWSPETLGRPFWIFFIAAFFFDFGFGLYFFLFNLFLLSLHFDERAMGIISAALTLGNVIGTIPVSVVARRSGLQKALLFCFIAAPAVSILRTAILWMPAQIGLAFLAGAALSAWPVCFAPTVARLTSESNRTFAFSIVFATGIGTGTLAGFAGGSLPQMLQGNHPGNHLADAMRLVLIGASFVAAIGIWPISRLSLGAKQPDEPRGGPVFHPFLARFLPPFAVWSIVIGSFIPFAPVYFQKQLGLSLQHVGAIFSASQLAQFCAVLVAPLLYRGVGSIKGIVCAQVLAGATIFALGRSPSAALAVVCYVAYTAVQFAASPGFYGILMDRVPEAQRSTASAVQNITGALSQAGAAALTGIAVVRFGYGVVFNSNLVLAVFSAILVLISLEKHKKQ